MALEYIRSQAGPRGSHDSEAHIYLGATLDTLADVTREAYLDLPNSEGIVPSNIITPYASIVDVQLMAYGNDCARFFCKLAASGKIQLVAVVGSGAAITPFPYSSATLSLVKQFRWGTNSQKIRIFEPSIKWNSHVDVGMPVGDFTGRIAVLNKGPGYVDLASLDSPFYPETLINMAVVNLL